ncbi:MAG: TonB-dependent receptor [Pseudomonadota bacterium]
MRFTLSKTNLLAGSALVAFALCGAPGVAAAQIVTAPVAQDEAQDDETARSDAGEIIVTAQRREERLQDVPIAISAISGSDLEARGISGSNQLAQVTPGFSFPQTGPFPQPTIRGIGTRGASAGEESVVPFYVDGVYQAFLAGQDLQFNNIERVEILKGPQGALLGRNAVGGAINIITKKPTKDGVEGAASFSYGRFNEIVAKGYLSAGNDVIGADIAVYRSKDDGYIKDLIANRTYMELDALSVRAKLRFDPAPWVNFLFSAAYVDNVGSGGGATQPVNRNTIGARVPGNTVATVPFTAALSFQPQNTLKQRVYSVVATFHAGPFDITSITGYQNNETRYLTDSDSTPADLNVLDYTMFSRNWVQEAYLTSTGTGPFSWIAGGMYFHDTAGDDPYTSKSRTVSTAGVIGAQATTFILPTLRTESYAAYFQGSYEFSPVFSLTLGGRYTWETRRAFSRIGSPTTLTLSNQASFEKFTPTATLQFTPSSDLNIFVKAGKGFKSGLFSHSATTVATYKPVRPENAVQYELGLKTRLAPGVRFEASGYYTDYKDLQVTTRDPVTLASLLQNAATARLYGLEASLTLSPSRQLDFNFGISAINGKYTSFPAAQVATPTLSGGVPIGGNTNVFIDATNKRLIRTPFLTLSAGGTYTVPVGDADVAFTGNLYYNGKSYWDIANRLAEKAYVLANAEITLSSDRFPVSLSVWGKNLLNEFYSQTIVSSATADTRIWARPRTYGLRIGAKF